MKQVTAVIKPFKLEEVRDPGRSGRHRFDSDRRSGFGRRRVIPSCIAAPSTWWTSCPKVKIEVVVKG